MKVWMTTLFAVVLMAGFAVPVIAQDSAPYQSDQDRDRERNSQAYHDGFAQGQADARAHAERNDRPTSEWTRDDDTRAYRQGYDAGYEEIMNGRDAAAPADHAGRYDRQSEQFGYSDGLAAGREDQMKGDKFKPQDHDYYKKANHGWTPELGTKAEFAQYYREGFLKGYQEGYRGAPPR